MHDVSPLIAVIAGGLGLAFVFGTIAQRFRLPPLVGYLLAGVAVGPFTPGFVADTHLALQLAEIGVILLMFGVGLHFSLRDLLSVKAIAIPGAVAQIAIATILGMGLSHLMGWNLGAGLIFGLALSVASTVVLLRAMQERRLIETERGRIAVGWLIVEDIAMVLALVLLPPMAEILNGETGGSMGAIASSLALTMGKLAAFVVLMLVVGRRVIPWVLHYVAHTGSRELFRLAVLAIALGFAYGAVVLFDVSFALGAFFAGMILSESELSQRAAHETLPLRDAFAVLFFVSVGMLFNPGIILKDWAPLLATILIVLVGKSVGAYAIVRMFRHSHGTALTISASLAQIGEFSFILAALGISLKLLPEQGRDLILAAAIVSIMLNPLIFTYLDRTLKDESPDEKGEPEHVTRQPLRPTALAGHAVLVGYGRVGKLIAEGLKDRALPLLVVEEGTVGDPDVEHIRGNAAKDDVLAAANLPAAKLLLVAIPQAFEAGRIVQQARKANPGLPIIARAHFDGEVDHLLGLGATQVIMGEREIALAMLDFAKAQ
ncbi:MAG TPA: YbaL family putative K(+) efflux transporter [Rhizomicrobium sp.]|jgi:CPA2 family monovalent cation:H+ antiporter-2|nr:YbaL family putative K(+) efflux transporter [Rhizomicrobium sp.]